MKPGSKNKLTSSLPYVGFLLVALAILAKHHGASVLFCCALSGFGSAWVGLGVFGVFLSKLSPKRVKQMEIDQNDERYIQIREKSGYASYLITMFILTIGIFLSFALDNSLACILAMSALAIHIAVFFIALFYYDKRL